MIRKSYAVRDCKRKRSLKGLMALCARVEDINHGIQSKICILAIRYSEDA